MWSCGEALGPEGSRAKSIGAEGFVWGFRGVGGSGRCVVSERGAGAAEGRKVRRRGVGC